MSKIFYISNKIFFVVSFFLFFNFNSGWGNFSADAKINEIPEFIKKILEEQRENTQVIVDSDNEDDEFFTRSFTLDDKKSSFYYEYISKYYPRAYVIRQKFLKMTPKQVVDALNDIVYVFVKEPWFYFQNVPTGFKLTYYWEYVLDQCGIIHNFLKRAKVDLKSDTVYLSNNLDFDDYWSCFWGIGDDSLSKNQNFLDYFKKNFIGVYTAFYALSFDYAVKFFNEGILLKDSKQANRFFSEIECIFEKLRDTPKESDYYESTKTCKELLGILKHKLGINYSFDDWRGAPKDFPQSGNKPKNLSQEILELTDVV